MKINENKIAVIISNKKGGCYQVYLEDWQRNCIIDLIVQMHEGKIKILRDKLSVTIGEKDAT